MLNNRFFATYSSYSPTLRTTSYSGQATVHALIIEALEYHHLPDCKELLRSDRVKPRKNNVPILLAIGGNNHSRGTASTRILQIRLE